MAWAWHNLWKHVTIGDDCWEYQGCRRPQGYGEVWDGRRRHSSIAHRVAWELANGPIPTGMDVCHHCDNPPCCRPSHLFLGTARENMLDAVSKGRVQPPNTQSLKTHCPAGHPYDATNTLHAGTAERPHRLCKTCRQARERTRDWKAAYQRRKQLRT